MVWKQYPILYIDIHSNKKRFWKLWIEKKGDIYLLCREYGILNGKMTIPNPIEMSDEKKIITKANMLFRKKKESGFYERNEMKQIKQMKQNIIKPMGAQKLDDYKHKLIYPVCVQKKLDGYRCLTHRNKENEIDLYTRNMKPYLYMDQIKNEYKQMKELTSNIYLDGELYVHGKKLHNIGSILRKKHIDESDIQKMNEIEYYVFDMFDIKNMEMTFRERYDFLSKLFKKYHSICKKIKFVTCVSCKNEKEIEKENEKYLLEGYEGVIVRNWNGKYEWNKKSYDVLRTKQFQKDIFEIKNAKEGSGSQKGAIIYEIKCGKHGKSFWTIPIGKIEDRKKQYEEFKKDKKKYIGKKVIIKYLEKDKNSCVTRNPILESWI